MGKNLSQRGLSLAKKKLLNWQLNFSYFKNNNLLLAAIVLHVMEKFSMGTTHFPGASISVKTNLTLLFSSYRRFELGS